MFRRRLQPVLVPWLVMVSLAGGLAGTQTKPQAGNNYVVRQWTAADGLAENRVTSMAQTPDGYLWIGAVHGLARFDGAVFIPFNESTRPDMGSQVINALAVDTEGRLWIGTAHGLLMLRNDRFTRFTTADGLPDRSVWRLAASRSGGVWMQSGEHILRWRNDRPTIMVKASVSPGESVRSIREEADGSLMVVTSHAMKRITPTGEVQPVALPFSSREPGERPRGGAWLQQDRLWVSTHTGLWLSRGGGWEHVVSGVNDADRGNFMYEDGAGCLWINLREAGFWRCCGNSVEPIKLMERGAERSVGCMLEGAEGEFWFGTDHGLFQLRPACIRAVTTDDGLPHEECWSVTEAPDGAVWVQTKAGLARIHDEQVQSFPEVLRAPYGRSVLADRSGTIWFRGNGELLIQWPLGLNPNGVRTSIAVESLCCDRDGRVWVGSHQGVTWFENTEALSPWGLFGATRFENSASDWGHFGLPTDEVRSIYQLRDGTMWFGTKAGAVRWKGQGVLRSGGAASPAGAGSGLPRKTAAQAEPLPEVTRFTTAEGLADDRVFVFHEDADGVLWIGTHNGLSRFKDGQFFTFRTEHGLLDNLINWFEEDDFGQFWFGCNRGIFRIARRELNDVADGKRARATAAIYGTVDGMPTPETNGEHQPAGCKGRDGKIWFPTPQGVVVIDPRLAKENEEQAGAPPLVIEQISADGEVIYGDDLKESKHEVRGAQLRLPPGRGRLLQFRYTANCFMDPRRVRFQYMLDGRDRDWREVTGERVAYYNDLKPGVYTFRVKAANPHGIWNESPATYEFSLAPHFYETWPFYALCGIAAVGLTGGLVGLRLRGQRRLLRLEHQRAMEQERARLARDLHDDLGTALTGLALEMDVAGRRVSETSDRSAVSGRLKSMADHSRALAARMREVVWAINPRCDDVPGVAAFLEQYAAPFARAAGLGCRLDFPEALPELSLAAEARHQLALGVREALANVVRHARATGVVLNLRVGSDALIVRVSDDGTGFDPARLNGAGQGLINLRSRLATLGGNVEWESDPGRGTTVTFRLPLNGSNGNGTP